MSWVIRAIRMGLGLERGRCLMNIPCLPDSMAVPMQPGCCSLNALNAFQLVFFSSQNSNAPVKDPCQASLLYHAPR